MNEAAAINSDAGAPKDQSLGDNRRGYPRRACRYQAMCRSAGRAWWPVDFVDLSLRGAGVMLSSTVEAGALLAFTVHTRNGRVVSIRAKVRHVEVRDGEWFAGCEFDRALTDSEFADLV